MHNLLNSVLLISTMTVVTMAEPIPSKGPCQPGDVCTTVTLKVPQYWISIMEDQIVDFEEWVYDAIEGKVNKCETRLLYQEINQSLKEGSEIPDTKYTIINKAFSRPGYKKRKDRENNGSEPTP